MFDWFWGMNIYYRNCDAVLNADSNYNIIITNLLDVICLYTLIALLPAN